MAIVEVITFHDERVDKDYIFNGSQRKILKMKQLFTNCYDPESVVVLTAPIELLPISGADLKLNQWCALYTSLQPHLNLDFHSIETNLATKALAPVWGTFKSSMAHGAETSFFPLAWFTCGKLLQLRETEAFMHITGHPIPTESESPRPEGFDEVLAQLFAPGAHGLIHLPASTIGEVYQYGVSGRRYFEPLMTMQLITAWTAFETFAGDLWETALNIHPQTLASRCLSSVGDDKESKKAIAARLIEECRFDTRNKMGTILREDRCRFDKREGIAKAYIAAFRDSCEIGNEKFWNNNDFQSGAALRNVIVHRGGRVDSKFTRERGNDPRLAKYKENDVISLDGGIVSSLLSGLINLAANIVTIIDEWIVKNPQKPLDEDENAEYPSA